MVEPGTLFDHLKKSGVGIFVGVPDSLLKSFCAYVDDRAEDGEHIITANEGNAIAIAAGYHLSTGNIGAVYMQNSGLGNAINPLVSIVDAGVYQIPMLMIIGWRGEPNVNDEPQHIKQGEITEAQLELLGIPAWILDADANLDKTLNEVFAKIKETNAPAAMLIRKNTFSPYEGKCSVVHMSDYHREDALRDLLDLVSDEDIVVSTTGKTSRELFELRVERGEPQRDFLTVGGMGHTSSIALGVSLGCPNKRVICIDGDGSALMHLGAVPIIGDVQPANFVHVLLNNAAHESVGGQPTVGGRIDFAAIAKASGYNGFEQADDPENMKVAWEKLATIKGPVLLEVRTTLGSRDNLGRPTSTPIENKQMFMDEFHA